jgi:hypothetical protein
MRNICGDLTRNGLVLKARQESSQRCKPLENWNNNLSTESAKDFIGRLICRIVSVALSELELFIVLLPDVSGKKRPSQLATFGSHLRCFLRNLFFYSHYLNGNCLNMHNLSFQFTIYH